MTSAILLYQQHTSLTPTPEKPRQISIKTMDRTNEKLRFSCIDNVGLKQLWRVIALNSKNNSIKKCDVVMNYLHQHSEHKHGIKNNSNRAHNELIDCENCENLSHYLINRELFQSHDLSLLKLFAINALELSAPATPVLLQQKPHSKKLVEPHGWMQLSGHSDNIVPTTSGVVHKRVMSKSDFEIHAYELISKEPETALIVPTYFGTREINKEHFIELQDLLAGFKDPCVMDIKMGCRTFLESEVNNKTMRSDLYRKMIAINANEPTVEENASQSITKLRYMLFREAMSSSQSRGFRIEALRLRGRSPIKDLKTCCTNEQISNTIEQFLAFRNSVQKELIKRLKHIRLVIEQSQFFNRHEIVGSSIFIIYDNEKVGAWLIDFAKSRELPLEVLVNHRAEWLPGNREEGLLKGMDELISTFEEMCTRKCSKRLCL